MIPPLPDIYRRFAAGEVGSRSPCYVEWANGVAGDPELLAMIDELGGVKRQPQLVFAAARFAGIEPAPFAVFREALITAWPRVAAVIMARRNQANEPGRCAALVPILAALPQPLALLEVGASAGLCLFPDRYSYVYGERRVDPVTGPSPVVLRCAVSGPVPVPRRLPTVAWRAGIDVNPLDLNDPDDMRWLAALVWPGQEMRRRRLATAIELVRATPPRIVRGDLNDTVAGVAAGAPAGATLVIVHSGVMTYLDPLARKRFTDTVRELPGHWASMEGPSVAPLLGGPAPPSPNPAETLFVVESDGVPVAYAAGQGQFLHWCAQP